MERTDKKIGHFYTWRTAILDSNLEPNCKYILIVLSTFMNEHCPSAFPSTNTLMKKTGLTVSTIIKYLKIAEEKGWIERQKRYKQNGGCSSNIYEARTPPSIGAIDPPSIGAIDPPSIGAIEDINSPDKNNSFINNSEGVKTPSQENISSKKPSLKERNEKFFPLAEKLSKTISSKKNIIHTTKQLNQWSNEFRILEEQNGIELKRQRKVLYEYSKIYGLDYVPEVESGSAFRQKFIKIEAAIERHKNPRKNNQQSKPTNRFMSKNNAPRDRIDVIVDNGVWTRLTNENGNRINV